MSVAKTIKLSADREDAEKESQLKPDEVIEDYLDHLCGPLIGLVPYEDRARFRQESQFNIEGRMDTYMRDGLTPHEAAREAINKYGDAQELSDRFLGEWMQHQQTGIFRILGKPNAYAAMFFSQATFVSLLALLNRIYNPSSAPDMVNIEEMRQTIPAPIPIPDSSPQTYVFFALLLFAPVLAGWATGRFAVVHAAKAAFRSQVLLTLGAFFLGSAMLPNTDGIFLALVQLLWWLPIGCLTAHLTAATVWRRQCASHKLPSRRNHKNE